MINNTTATLHKKESENSSIQLKLQEEFKQAAYNNYLSWNLTETNR